MKSLLIMLIFVSLVISSYAYPDMEGYPDFFTEEGGIFSVTLVVGENAPSSDVLSATDIAGYLAFKTQSEHITSVLSNEISSYQQDLILIGNPCDNPHVAHFLQAPDNTNCRVTNKGEALITAFKEGNYISVVVAGNTPEGTRVAAKILQEPDVFKIEGSELCVYGSFSNPFVEDCATSHYVAPEKKSVSDLKDSDAKLNNKEIEKITTPPKKTPSKPLDLTPKPANCNGCLDADKICYLSGEQATVNDRTAYCKDDHTWYAAKEDGKACNDNYQCKHNYCVENICTSTPPPEKPFLSRFFSWIWDVMFG